MSHPYEITNEMIEDLLDAAGYFSIHWCDKWETDADVAYPSEALTNGGTMRVHVVGDAAPGEVRWMTLTLDKFKKGIREAAKLKGLTVARYYDEHDSIDADMAVQIGLFGKVVYG